jgi:predicted transcriptional regulator of viral defense system
MARRRQQEELDRTLVRFFEQQARHAFRESDLKAFLYQYADEWRLPQRLRSVPKFTDYMGQRGLQKIKLESEHYRNATRYIWGSIRPYEVALTLGKRAYFSHATAMFLRGLTDQIPKTIYVNEEQTPKNFGTPVLTQHGIDRAFAGKQRTSRAVYSHDGVRILVVSGKWTNRLEVGQLNAPDDTMADATKVERTLIDISVRPDYAGGPHQVLRAYEAAREKLSVNVMVATLKKLGHAYPYHQVIGFYMTRAGHSARQTEALKQFGLSFKFYLTYGMKNPDYDDAWQLFIPKGF